VLQTCFSFFGETGKKQNSFFRRLFSLGKFRVGEKFALYFISDVFYLFISNNAPEINKNRAFLL